VFEEARQRFAPAIRRWGFVADREDYRAALAACDVVVSTAAHEFFGISVVEAVAAGAFPVVPDRLAYPEVLSHPRSDAPPDFFYSGETEDLAARLEALAAKLERGDLWNGEPELGIRLVERFAWDRVAPVLDDEIEEVTGASRPSP
jgi:glycosyltransferase involved in cell wall biosynthesis